jgi:hypothetical protein
MRLSIFAAAVAAGVVAVASPPAQAGLVGSMVSVTGYFGATTNPPPACNPFTILCGFAQSPYSGGTTSETDVVPTGTLYEYLATATSIVVSGGQITIANLVDPSKNNPLFCTTALPCHDVFDGLVFAFTGNNPITSVAVDPSTANADFQPRSINFDAHTIYVDLTGADPSSLGETLVLDVTAPATRPPVPEPSTWALLLAGFAGLGWVSWRKRMLRAA